MIVFVTQDLMILSAARSVLPESSSLKQVASITRLKALITETSVRVLLVDLQTPGLDLNALAAAHASLEPTPKMVAFAQHVNIALLEEAKKRLPHVLTRGQFNSKLPEILAQD